MKVFTKEDKLCQLVLHDVNLLPVINRFGIKLGFKEKTVEEVCKEHDVNTDFFLAITNTYINEYYFPELKLLSFSPVLIIEYLKQTHHYYFTHIIPKIERLINRVVDDKAEGDESLAIINSFYKKYKQELILHLEEEEDKTFPYILHLVNENAFPESDMRIKDIRQEHGDVETKLSDLKNLIIKYLEPKYDINAMNDFLHTLYHFEQDLSDHSRIEDAILIPHVLEIEEQLRNKRS